MNHSNEISARTSRTRARRPRAGSIRCRRNRRAFTIVELLVVIAIMGVLVAILLPAVQYTREAARRTQCSNHLRNQLLALQLFHDKENRFPSGRGYWFGHEHSWCLEVLPYLEQQSLADKFDRRRGWQDPAGNLAVADTVLPVFRCPSSNLRSAGDTDYGGITGSALTSPTWAGSMNNGVMLEIPETGRLRIDIGSILDGTSNTICIAESSDRKEEAGRWISGFNIFSHDNGGINTDTSGEIYSDHRSGAFVGFADGGTRFLSKEIDKYVVGAICTRSHGEILDDLAF